MESPTCIANLKVSKHAWKTVTQCKTLTCWKDCGDGINTVQSLTVISFQSVVANCSPRKPSSQCTVLIWLTLTPSTPAVPNCCCSQGPGPYWSNPPFLIFDIRALWRSVLSARAPECQKLKMVGQNSMAKCKASMGSAVKGLSQQVYGLKDMNKQRDQAREPKRRKTAGIVCCCYAVS